MSQEIAGKKTHELFYVANNFPIYYVNFTMYTIQYTQQYEILHKSLHNYLVKKTLITEVGTFSQVTISPSVLLWQIAPIDNIVDLLIMKTPLLLLSNMKT